MSTFVRSQILGLFLNKLTFDEKYSRHKRDNFKQLIQSEISKKLKNLFQKKKD